MTGAEISSKILYGNRLTKIVSGIRVWTSGGDLVYELHGHTSFVYSLDVLPTGEIVSSGEDRTVRIWKGNM